MSSADRPAWVKAEYERIGRERAQASRESDRIYRWDLVRTCAEMFGWTAVGCVIAAFGFHVHDREIGWILFDSGVIVNLSGVVWAIHKAYKRGQARGDW